MNAAVAGMLAAARRVNTGGRRCNDANSEEPRRATGPGSGSPSVAAMPHDGRRRRTRRRGFSTLPPLPMGFSMSRSGSASPPCSPQIRRPRQMCGRPKRLPLPNATSAGLERIIARASAISPDADSVSGKVVPLAPRRGRRLLQSFCTVGKPCGGHRIGRLARLCDGQRHLACAQRSSAAQRDRPLPELTCVVPNPFTKKPHRVTPQF